MRTSAAADLAGFEQHFAARVRDWGSDLDTESVSSFALAPHGPLPAGALPIGWWQAPRGAARFPAVFSEPFTTIEEIQRNCWETMVRLLAGLGARLNEIHGTDHPAIYWRTLLAPWLLTVVSVILDRRVTCLGAHALAPDAEFLTTRPLGPSATAGAWAYGLSEPHRHHDLLSRMVEAMELPIRQLACHEDCCAATGDRSAGVPDARRSRGLALPRLDLPTRKLQLAGLVCGGRRGRRVQLIDVVSPSQALMLYARVRGCRSASRAAVIGGYSPGSVQAPVDHRRRQELLSVPATSPTESLIVKLLPGLVPVSLIEAYGHTVSESHRVFGPPTHAVHGMYGSDEVQNEFLSRCLAAGRRVAFAQHGGVYGQLKVQGGIRLEQWPETPFLSWGWHAAGVVPLPSARLSRLRDRHRGGDDMVVVEGAPVEKLVAHKGFGTVHLQAVLDIPERLTRFAQALGDDGLRSRLVFKPYPSGGSSNTAVQLMRRARLALITYFDTPFHEALALNVPMIAFWDPDGYGLAEEAQELLARLARVGVFHPTPEAAAATVRSVYAHADEWWAQPPIQDARLAFLDRYGKSEGFTGAWANYLRCFRS